MNEDEMNRLFAGYRDGLGRCGRSPVRRPKPRRLAWVLAAGGAAALTAGVALWPTESAAKAAVLKMGAALREVRTMDMTYEVQRPSGKWVVFDRERYRNGAWRLDVDKGRGLRATYFVRDGLLTTDYERLDHATRRVLPEDFLESSRSQGDPLEYAKRLIDSGHTDIDRSVRLTSQGATYRMTFDRAVDRYHAEIVVDSKTNLPISAESSVDYGPKQGGLARFRQTYRFNEPLDAEQFAPTKRRRVVDLQQARSGLAKRWGTPVASVGETHVREACVTADGTIWVVVTRKDLGGKVELPTSLDGYVSLGDLAPTAFEDRSAAFQVDGEEVAVFGFVPLDPAASLPTSATVGFARRFAAWPQFSPPKDTVEESVESPTLRLRRDANSIPEWFTALDLDYEALGLEVKAIGVRADALERTGRALEAAHAYERCAEAWRAYVVYRAYLPLERAAALYDKLGRAADAARTRAKAATLKAGRER